MKPKVLGKTNPMMDEGARCAYFSQPPPIGVTGVDVNNIVDVDETGVWLAWCRRKRGHVMRGDQAETDTPYNVNQNFSCIISIDIGVVVTYAISDSPGMTTEIRFAFLTNLLLPVHSAHLHASVNSFGQPVCASQR